MHLSFPIVAHILHAAAVYKYSLAFVGVVLEGPAIMIVCGFLIHLGTFKLVPIFLTLVAGDLVGDIVWYYIGYFFLEPFMKKHGHFLSVTPELFEKAKGLFHRYHMRILLISKVTLGFGMSMVTLTGAGAMRIPFRKYMALNAAGEIFLVGILLAIGNYLGYLSGTIVKDLRVLFLVGTGLILCAAVFGFSRYVKNKIFRT